MGLVNGLDADAANVEKARAHVRSLGLYGPVSVDRLTGPRLPYTGNLVNLLVAEDLGDVSMAEVLRVLVPGGVAYVGKDGSWEKTIKPWPPELDEWTHFLHDASGNAVSQDREVGPPRRLKWVCGPLWSRSHEFPSSLAAMVSGGGRLFYIVDEGLTSLTERPIPERWTLVARDGQNGILLWKRPIEKWGTAAWRSRALRSIPATLPRRLVAQGDRLFFTLGYGEPVSALDAATGETLATYEETEGAEEVLAIGGVLLVRRHDGVLLALDPARGRTVWEAGARVRPLSLAAADGRVFCQEGPAIVCRSLADGAEQWRTPVKGGVALLLVHDGRVILLAPPGLQALSAESGETLWTVNAGRLRPELFAAGGKLWHWEGDRVVGRDLATGEVTARPDTSDVFTPGHHLRCYQGKATERFLITPYRGAEFVSVDGGVNTQNDWIRGACRYGVMPSAGLLYVPPNPCFCFPGVKLTGFNAFAPARDDLQETASPRDPASRLEHGPAYGQPTTPHSSPITSFPWPTYRHDARRTGATDAEVSPQLAERWRTRLRGPLTPPVVAEGRVLVAAKDEQTLYALDADAGDELWHFTAGGRIDSPPTVHAGLVLFGSADGRVTCLRADDGQLVWRFMAAPSDRRIVAFGRLESPWRVHGSVLVEDGLAYFTAGRSTYLDGGIQVFALEPATGEVVHQTCLDTWSRTREDARGKPFVPAYHMEGAQSDVLVSQGGFLYLGQVKLDLDLVRQEVPYVLPSKGEKTVAMDLTGKPYTAADENPKADYEKHQRDWIEHVQPQLLAELRAAHGTYGLGQRQMGLHVLSMAGFLDDTWFNRTFWTYSADWPGYYLAHRAPKTGQLLAVGPEKTYAVGAFPSRNLQSPLFTPGEKGYLLLADANDNEPVLDDRTRGTTKGWGYTRLKPPEWFDWVPIRIRAMVLARQTLFVAGPPDVVPEDDPMAAFEGRAGGVLRAVSANDGRTLSEQKLDSPPVFDGLIAAGGRLYATLGDGSVMCLGPGL